MPTTTKTLDAMAEASIIDHAIRALICFALAGCLCGWLGWMVPAALCGALVVLCGGIVIYLDALFDEARMARDDAGFLIPAPEEPKA